MGTGRNEHFTSVLTMELRTYIYEDGQGTVLGKAHSGHVYSTCLAKATRMETGSNGGSTGDTAMAGRGFTVCQNSTPVSLVVSYQI